ncbi:MULTISPECIES: hypothetical protein [unclassified Streptomyces]|uniref:hypothetical protein n=1 Tax=unclassified Streptomyces TaxID=2593676 RepID=UPI00344A6E39
MTRAAGSGARRSRCPRCARPVLLQLVGRSAALSVVADAEQMTAAAAEALREPNRLHWCVRSGRDGLDLMWADCRTRRTPCERPHVIDHKCTAPQVPARPAAQRRTRQPSPVPAGQLTL